MLETLRARCEAMRPPSKPPIVEQRRPGRATAMDHVVRDLSKILQAMAVTSGPLPTEAERIVRQHLHEGFELGQRAAQRIIFELKQECTQLREKIRRQKEYEQDLLREIRLLRESRK